jgi:hypothetical protein
VTLASPISGHARIVFFINGFQGPQRENYYSLLQRNHGIFASGNPPLRHAFSRDEKSIFQKEISSFRAASERSSVRGPGQVSQVCDRDLCGAEKALSNRPCSALPLPLSLALKGLAMPPL